MVGGRACSARTKAGERCAATPLRDEDLCFWHAPDHAEEAAEARRIGGMRRRREKTVAGAYELDELHTVVGVRRVLEIAIIDALGLENSIARSRVLISGVIAAARLLEVHELDERLQSVEAALGPRLLKGGRR